jgi:hypothetical protein
VVGVWIHAALQHVPLYRCLELGTSDVAGRTMAGTRRKSGRKGSCQIRNMKGAASNEGKSQHGIRYVKCDNKGRRACLGVEQRNVKKTGRSEG